MPIIDATSIEEIKRQLQPYLGGYAWTTDQDRKGFALCVGDCGGSVIAELTSLLESKHKAAGGPMTIHPRHNPTTEAKIAISEAVVAAVKKHDLSYAELISILAQEIAGWTKFQIRDERNPPTEGE